jgi:peptidoglycan/LPS O-acetylase OafA/YrhL
MQFYLVVPVLFVVLEFLDKVQLKLKLLLIGCIPLASFLFQTFSTGDSSHMLLTARLWQFFFGFAAHYAYENRALNFVKDGEEAGKFLIVWKNQIFETNFRIDKAK